MMEQLLEKEVKLELTVQERAKVYATYFPCNVLFQKEVETRLETIDFIQEDYVLLENYGFNQRTVGFKNKALKLLLTPLELITDEHLKVVAKLKGHISKSKNVLLERGKEIITEIITFDGNLTINIISQYLIQQGYDVPLFFDIDHWANGKTPIELGIAIDKTKVL